jgi:hypothetical protein
MRAAAIPDGPESLTPTWIGECLKAAGTACNANIRSVEVQRFAEGVGLLGQLARVRIHYDGERNDGPEALVVKFPAAAPQNVALCEAIRLYWREHHFYTQSASETPLRVPRLYHSAMEGMAKFVLVLEEIQGAVAGDQIRGATPEQVRIAARRIAQHHAKFWGRAQQGATAWLPALNDRTLLEVIRSLTAAGTPDLLAQLPECFSEETRQVVLRLPEVMPALTDLICSGATTFVHGDFRVDNLFFGTAEGSSELTVVDWQICYEACGPYDIAYLMTQSVPAAIRREIEPEILRTYHDVLLSTGVKDYDFETCREDYRRAATYCICYPLIAAGTLDLSNERGRELGKMMLERALSAAEDVRSLALIEAL